MPSSQRIYNWYISLVAACCMVLYGYDAAVFNAVFGSDNWKAYNGNPGASLQGTMNTAYTVAAIGAGYFFSAPISDTFGRRVTMATGCFIVIGATFLQAFGPSGSAGPFIAGRALVGFGQGLALPAGPVYIGELAPPEIRGKIMSFWQLFYSVGSFIAYWINYICTKKQKAGKLPKNWDWRIVVLFQIMTPIFIIVAIFFCPESPRFYVAKGKLEQARQSLRQVRETEEMVEEEMVQIRQAVEYEKESVGGGRYLPLWKDKTIRKRLLLAFAINIGQQITGQGSLNAYSTKIYTPVFNSNSTVQLINALNATVAILFTLNATWTVDRYGRKMVLFVGACGMAICMLLAGAVVSETPGDLKHKSHGVGIAAVFLLFLFSFFYKPSWGATVWIWTSEVFSMNVRAQAVAMSSQMQNVSNLVVNQIFPNIYDAIHFRVMYMFFGINIILAVFVWFLLPETKGVLLEEIDTLFGGASHVDKGAALVHDNQGNVIHGKTADDGVGMTVAELEIARTDLDEEVRMSRKY